MGGNNNGCASYDTWEPQARLEISSTKYCDCGLEQSIILFDVGPSYSVNRSQLMHRFATTLTSGLGQVNMDYAELGNVFQFREFATGFSCHYHVRPKRDDLCMRSMAFSPRAFSESWTFPITGFETIDRSQKVEEESASKVGNLVILFCPIRIGEAYRRRYQIVSKLGYGLSSTVWLCRDLSYVQLNLSIHQFMHVMTHPLQRQCRYKGLKLYNVSQVANREIEMYKHLNTVHSGYTGRSSI
jgi:hypothetical protein